MRSKRYFNWMYSLAIGKSRNFYRSLLLYLDSRTFTWSVRMDVNRAKDGCNLRKRFIEEEDGTFTKPEGTPCSVLEMMVALCVRCEEQIMSNPDLGNRVPVWFMAMLRSMEIDDMDEANFDETVVEVIVLVCLVGVDRQHRHDADDPDTLSEDVLDGVVHYFVIVCGKREDTR